MSNAKKVRTTSFKKPPPTSLADMNTEPVAKPLVNDDVHPIKVETLPSQVQPIHSSARRRRIAACRTMPTMTNRSSAAATEYAPSTAGTRSPSTAAAAGNRGAASTRTGTAMTDCNSCAAWYATTEQEWRIRQRNIKLYPNVRAHVCLSCGRQRLGNVAPIHQTKQALVRTLARLVEHMAAVKIIIISPDAEVRRQLRLLLQQHAAGG